MKIKENVLLAVAWLSALFNGTMALSFDKVQMVLYIASLIITLLTSILSLIIKLKKFLDDGKIDEKEAKELYDDAKNIAEQGQVIIKEAKEIGENEKPR